MEFQSTGPQSLSYGLPYFLGLLLCPAVCDDIISVSLKRYLRVVHAQPSIQCIMQKQIGQEWAYYPTLRSAFLPWNQSPILLLHWRF